MTNKRNGKNFQIPNIQRKKKKNQKLYKGLSFALSMTITKFVPCCFYARLCSMCFARWSEWRSVINIPRSHITNASARTLYYQNADGNGWVLETSTKQHRIFTYNSNTKTHYKNKITGTMCIKICFSGGFGVQFNAIYSLEWSNSPPHRQ